MTADNPTTSEPLEIDGIVNPAAFRRRFGAPTSPTGNKKHRRYNGNGDRRYHGNYKNKRK